MAHFFFVDLNQELCTRRKGILYEQTSPFRFSSTRLL